MIKVDKKKDNNKQKNFKVNRQKENTDHEDYGYDFVPGFNEWLNIDEQKEKAEELEEI